MKLKLLLEPVIEVEERNKKQCSPYCDYIRKRDGLYRCGLFNNEVVDKGDDENGDYLFLRCQPCLNKEQTIYGTTREVKE